MTENEAKTKWCPFGRVVEVADDKLFGPFNRYHSSVPDRGTESRCIGTECMAWRSHGWADNFDADRGVFKKSRDMYPRASESPIDPFKLWGYCGAAGKP